MKEKAPTKPVEEPMTRVDFMSRISLMERQYCNEIEGILQKLKAIREVRNNVLVSESDGLGVRFYETEGQIGFQAFEKKLGFKTEEQK